MTAEQKKDLIATLVACKHSGFTDGDQAMLETASDERLEAFRVAAEARVREVQEIKAAETKQLTEEEFMKAAPPEIRSLITRQKKQETEFKADLVAELKTAQEEYAEAELANMPIEQLERLARMARVQVQPHYEGRGVVRQLAGKKDDVYANPPDPYAEAIAARRKATVN